MIIRRSCGQVLRFCNRVSSNILWYLDSLFSCPRVAFRSANTRGCVFVKKVPDLLIILVQMRNLARLASIAHKLLSELVDVLVALLVFGYKSSNLCSLERFDNV